MTAMLFAVSSIGFSFGAIFGIVMGVRHLELECEKAYLTGHVDGYNKAVADSGEVSQ